ncbi:hypothetical protein [Cohnella terricola]|uniref:Uncharacterized protein n=1 Tax=Cohnella terricola TaxID=1289167 RepID=A0A559J5Q7_9BACL|nr:hypothetical protein [Cohnella terricola]TVX95202.1 hypothetical protein FPZ45_23980 [Cohnella terricola]
MFKPNQLNTNKGYAYGEVYEKKGLRLQEILGTLEYQTKVNELTQEWKKDEVSSFRKLDVDGTLWSIQHEKGEWKAHINGSYSLQGGNVSLFGGELNALSFVPADERGEKPDWAMLTASYPDARDAVLSPDGHTAVILLTDTCIISIVEAGQYSAPLKSWSIRPHTNIVMSRWVDGDVTKTWDEQLELWNRIGNYRLGGGLPS